MAGSVSATTAMYAMMAATAVSVIGQAQSAKQQKEMYNAQAQQALNEGAYKADAAKAQAESIRKAGKAQAGEATASLAASGVKLGEGTALEVKKQVTQNVEQDALSALISGNRATSAASTEASLLGKAGDNAITNAQYSAASTVLSSASTVMKNWKGGAKS